MIVWRTHVSLLVMLLPTGCARSGSPLDAPVIPRHPGSSDTPTAVFGQQDCPPGMAFVPGGRFDGVPLPWGWSLFKADLTIRDLCVDATEVTVGAYEACVIAGACTPTIPTSVKPLCTATQASDYPINCVSVEQAVAFCSFHSSRLPTAFEAEWGRRGGQAVDPFAAAGLTTVMAFACVGQKAVCRVRSFPPDRNGIFDATGNVSEWTSTHRLALNVSHHIVAGGSFTTQEKDFADSSQTFVTSDAVFHSIGFRCVWSPQPS